MVKIIIMYVFIQKGDGIFNISDSIVKCFV